MVHLDLGKAWREEDLREEKVPWMAEVVAEVDLASSSDSASAGLASSSFAELVFSEGFEAGAAATGFVEDVLEEEVVAIEAFDVVAVVAVGCADVAETDAAVAAAVVGTYSGTVLKVAEGLVDWDSGSEVAATVTSRPPLAPMPCPHLESHPPHEQDQEQ